MRFFINEVPQLPISFFFATNKQWRPRGIPTARPSRWQRDVLPLNYEAINLSFQIVNKGDSKLNFGYVLTLIIFYLWYDKNLTKVFLCAYIRISHKTSGTPYWTQTNDTELRRFVLYSTELKAHMAGSVGFEPTDGLAPPTVFKTASLNLSDNFPVNICFFA